MEGNIQADLKVRLCGSRQRTVQTVRASKSRSTAREGVMWSETWRDLRLAARTLRGSPMFTLTAMLSLAIGIGGTAVIFGVVDAYPDSPMARHR